MSANQQSAVHLEVEMKENDHLPIARLEERVPYVVVEDVDLVATNRRETETCRDNHIIITAS